jgi:uncharacterized protein YheU (UPF0270 family)
MIIPYEILSRKVFQGLVEEFVTREGTDSDFTKKSLEENIEIIKRQLENRDAFIVYDKATQTSKIISKNQLELKMIIDLPL